MKLTKIVCTIGPASEKSTVLEQLIRAGMNVARLNFSHGTHVNHAKLIRMVRAASKKCGEPVAIMQDLQGPRIRIGEVPERGVALQRGEQIVLVPQTMFHAKDSRKLLPNHCPQLAKDVRAGNRILIADGMIELKVVRVSGPEIHCTVIQGGVVTSHKGMNVPGAHLTIASITDKDKEDIAFGVARGVDYIALSFVRNGEDVIALRRILRKAQGSDGKSLPIGIIAKIEREEALHNFDSILSAADGIMVARGDLGIEIPAERVPVAQKTLIEKCIAARKPVIVATQMMESMIASRRPTRAEVSDVANAVIDHTDAVMLSGESATGRYPRETVDIMARTIRETERSRFDNFRCERISHEKTPAEMIAHAAAEIALTKQVKLILSKTNGEMTRLLASHRPEVRIVGFSSESRVRQGNNLIRGVTLYPQQKNPYAFLKKVKLARPGDLILTVEDDELELKRLK